MVGMVVGHDQASDGSAAEGIGPGGFGLLANYPQGEAAIHHRPAINVAEQPQTRGVWPKRQIGQEPMHAWRNLDRPTRGRRRRKRQTLDRRNHLDIVYPQCRAAKLSRLYRLMSTLSGMGTNTTPKKDCKNPVLGRSNIATRSSERFASPGSPFIPIARPGGEKEHAEVLLDNVSCIFGVGDSGDRILFEPLFVAKIWTHYHQPA